MKRMLILAGMLALLGPDRLMAQEAATTFRFKWVRLGMPLGELKDSLRSQMKMDESMFFFTKDIYEDHLMYPTGVTVDSIGINTEEVNTGATGSLGCYLDPETREASCLEYTGIRIIISSERVSGVVLYHSTDVSREIHTWLHIITNGIAYQLGRPAESGMGKLTTSSIESKRAYDGNQLTTMWSVKNGPDSVIASTGYKAIANFDYKYLAWMEVRLRNTVLDSLHNARVEPLIRARKQRDE